MSGPSASRSAPNFARSSATRAAVRTGVPGPVRRRSRRRGVATRPAVEAGPDLEAPEPERAVQPSLIDGFLERPRAGATRRVERQTVVGRPAQELVDRPAERLAGDVPQGHLEARQHGQPDPDASPPQRALVQLAEGRLGLARVETEAHQQAAVIVDDRCDDLGVEVAHDRLADAGDALIRVDHDERRGPLEPLVRGPRTGRRSRAPSRGRCGHPSPARDRPQPAASTTMSRGTAVASAMPHIPASSASSSRERRARARHRPRRPTASPT